MPYEVKVYLVGMCATAWAMAYRFTARGTSLDRIELVLATVFCSMLWPAVLFFGVMVGLPAALGARMAERTRRRAAAKREALEAAHRAVVAHVAGSENAQSGLKR